MEIYTKRLFIKNITLNEVSQNYLNWLNDKETMKYLNINNIQNLDSLKKFVTNKIKDNNILFASIFDKFKLNHIGNIKYEPINVDNKYAVLGILIGEKKYQGLGLAKEIILSCNQYLKKKYNLNNIYLGCHKENIYAIKAYEKIGFFKNIEKTKLQLDNDAIEMKMII